MVSWRDSVSDAALDHVDELYEASMELATGMLRRRGEFYPFGFAMTTAGETALLAADPGLGEHPPSTTVLDLLLEAARDGRNEAVAVAITADVTVPGRRDAVRLELEHVDGLALEILVPYRRRRLRGAIVLYEMSISEGTRRVWVDPAS